MGLRSNPTYRQRRLGAELRKLRERSGLSSYDMAARLGMHQPQLSHIETGRTGMNADRVRRMAGIAGISDTTFVEALLEMAQDSGKGWWSAYRRTLPQPHLDFAELEANASRLLNYEPMFVPGLLQTPDYAVAVHRGGYVGGTTEEHEAAVDFRLRRQRVLTGERAPRFHAVVHEAALHATFGDPQIMRGQLLRLIELSRLPNVTIQVLPFDGPVPFGTAFTVAEPDVPALGTLVITHVDESRYLGDEEWLGSYKHAFARLSEAALPPVDANVRPESHAAKDSLGLIQRLLYPLL